MIYTIPLILLVIGFLSYDNNKPSKRANFLWGFIYIFLVLMIGLRYKVGGDTYNYMTYFSWAPELKYWEPFDLSGFEPGFSLLTSAIKTLTDDIYVYQTIISASATFMLMHFIRKHTPYRFLGMLLVFVSMYLYFSTEVIRESLAIGGLLMSYDLALKRKYLPYYAICLLLVTLHSSAVIGFLLPFFRYLKLDKKFLLWVICTIIVGFALSSFMGWLAQYYIFSKLLRYNTQLHVGYGWIGFRFIYFALLPYLTLRLNKKYFHIPLEYEHLICLQILMGISLWFVPIVFQRLINYTIIFYLVSLAHIIGTSLRDREYLTAYTLGGVRMRGQLAKILLVLTICAHSTYYIHLHFHERYIPYHSIFDPIEEPMREKYVAGQD